MFTAKLPGQQARLAVLTATAFNTFGMGLILIDTHDDNISRWPLYCSALIGTTLFSILFFKPNKPSRSQTSSFFIVNAMTITIALFALSFFYSHQQVNWIPFHPNQLGCLVAAILSPTFFTGALAILIHAGMPIYQHSIQSPLIQETLISSETLATLAFGFAGLFVLAFRFQRLVIEQGYAKMLAENESMKAVAQQFLYLRDLMNTPLQTLEFTLEMLAQKNSDAELIQRSKRALSELSKMNSILKKYESELDWKPSDSAFDGLSVLDKSASKK